MERKNNSAIQAGQARKLFCAHDLDEVVRAHRLRTDETFLYLRLLSEDYRVSRAGGHIARREGEAWAPADGFDETLTIFDLLCDAKPGRHAAGAWKTTLDFGGQVHRGLMEPDRADELELLYDRQPELLETWLTRILINTCHKELRRRRRVTGEESLPDSAGPDAYDGLPLREAIRRLPEELRTVVILRYFAGYTLE